MTYGLDIISCGLWNVVQCWVTYESIESIMNFIQSHVHVEKESSSVHTLISNACVTFVIASESMPQILQTISSLAYQIFLYSLHYRMDVSEASGFKMVSYTTKQGIYCEDF
jgi:hypothetical protein